MLVSGSAESSKSCALCHSRVGKIAFSIKVRVGLTSEPAPPIPSR